MILFALSVRARLVCVLVCVILRDIQKCVVLLSQDTFLNLVHWDTDMV